MNIYTKKGDKGKTSLYRSKTPQSKYISKSSPQIRAMGAIDELNSYLGVISSQTEEKLTQIIESIQEDLFTISSIVAGANIRFYSSKAKNFEKQINLMQRKLPKLKNFVYPGGSVIGAQLYYVRTLARRAERAIITLNKKEKIKPQVLIYLNRLSDYLFVLARAENQNRGAIEKTWQGIK